MEVFDINRKTFERNISIREFTEINMNMLQNAEAMIFIQYKDSIWKKKVLDIGCGGGRTTYFLMRLTSNYTGIDYSLPLIEHCEFKYPELSFYHYDARKLDLFPNDSFDFVLFSFNGIDYMNHDDRILCLQEISRVLRANGLFTFSSHNRNAISGGIRPRVFTTKNVIRNGRNALRYAHYLFMQMKLQKHLSDQEEYAIVHDSGLHNSLVTYYISPDSQIRQLESCGFNLIELYDAYGKLVKIGDEAKNSPWLYYVVRKAV